MPIRNQVPICCGGVQTASEDGGGYSRTLCDMLQSKGSAEVMPVYVVFLAVSFLASIVGAVCGIGGGVIIKPVLDAFGGLMYQRSASFRAARSSP